MGSRERESLDLAGEWRFRLDPEDKGIAGKWWGGSLPDAAHLPGSTDENGYGEEPSEREPNRLTRLHKYVGAAWYQRDVVIPAEWEGKRITLLLERCHWETRIWVDGQQVGLEDSLCVPHEYDLTGFMEVGQHQLTIRVDNTIKYPVGQHIFTEMPVAHSVTEDTQTNWNGIVGRIEMVATDGIWVEDLQVYSDIQAKSVRVVATIGMRQGRQGMGRYRWRPRNWPGTMKG